MHDIKNYNTFIKIEPVNKGWSSDKKYYIETAEGRRLLLRVADISEYDRKKVEYEMMKQVAALGVPMSQPVDFGICDNVKSVYSLLTWCDGEDAEAILPRLTETEQYVLGVKSGEILKKIHSIPAPKEQEEWGIRFNRKTSIKIDKYKACGIKFDSDDKIIDFIENNRHLLSGRPQCYQHGDYHVGNMIISQAHTLSIIDFNRPDYGDPWEEFNRIVWSATVSPHFATGQLNGYFGGRPPIEFFRLLAFYISSNTLSSIYWAIPFGENEVTTMKNQARDVLSWFDNMNNPVPTWYLENYYVQYIDNVPYKLKSPFDMSFIRQYGEVFKVYDDQDSGNICFGVQNGGDRYFIKFAGAPTERYPGTPEDAINRLKTTVPVYQDLAHPNLIKFFKAEEIGGGFAVIFEWTDSEIVSFISAYAPIVDCLKAYPHEIKQRKNQFLQYLSDGRNKKEFGFTDAYFINPENIESLFSGFPMKTIRIMAAEGLGAMCENSLMQLPEEDFMEWVDLLYKISDSKVSWGSCEHLLYVGKKIDKGEGWKE